MALGLGELFALILFGLYIWWKVSSWSLLLFTAGVILVTALTYWYMRYQRGRWARLGIKTPPCNLVVGHVGAITSGIGDADIEWTKKYGRIFGTYIFWQDDLVVSDLNILRHVLAKDFPNFTNRRQQLGDRKHGTTLLSKVLTVLTDQHWKDVRSTVTPSFTTGKMKNMVPLFNGCLEIFSEIVGQKADSNEPLEIKNLCAAFSMDIISKSSFGMDIDAQHDSNSPFVKYAAQIFAFSIRSFGIFVLFMFPNVMMFLERHFGVVTVFKEGDQFFKSALRKVFAERERHPKVKNPDFLQLILNTLKSSNEGQLAGDREDFDHEIMHEALKGGKNVQLSELEAMAQCFLFLIAGYETTSATLQFVFYILATYPDIQQQCYEEVMEVMGEDSKSDEITYEQTKRFTYIDQVISETLRMFPPAKRIDRHCANDTVIEGLHIPGGCVVSVPVYAMHKDPEYYPEPEKFDPERFSPEEKAKRDPLCYLPFGYGPRNCLGMRFAQLEIRMTVAYLLRKFRFFPTDQTEKFPPKLDPEGFTKPAQPIVLGVERRQY